MNLKHRAGHKDTGSLVFLFITMKMKTDSGKAFLKLLQLDALEKAKTACENPGLKAQDHFADVGKMIKIGKGGQGEVD